MIVIILLPLLSQKLKVFLLVLLLPFHILSVSMSKFPVGFCAISSQSPPTPPSLRSQVDDSKVFLSTYSMLLSETLGWDYLI